MNKLKNLTVIGLADIIGNVLTSIFWFYLATLIEPAQYGEIHYFIGIASIASIISLFSTQNTLVVYTAKNVKIQATFYLISLVIGTISSLMVIIIFFRIDTVVVLIGYIINTLAIGELLGKKLYSSYSRYILLQKVLTLVLGLGFFYLFGIDGILYALALSYIGFALRIFKGFKESKVNFSLLKPRLCFITNNYIISLVSGFDGQIDKLIIGPFLGFVLLGNYSLALQVISILMIFSTIVFKYILPQDVDGKQNSKLKKFSIIIAIIVTIVSITSVPFVMPVVFPKYSGVIDAIQIMSFSIILATIGMIYTSKFLALEKSKFILISTLISLVIFGTTIIILGPIFGVTGLAIAHLLSTTISVSYLVTMDRLHNKV